MCQQHTYITCDFLMQIIRYVEISFCFQLMKTLELFDKILSSTLSTHYVSLTPLFDNGHHKHMRKEEQRHRRDI